MPLQERREALQKVDPSLYGIYETEVKYFLKYFDEMERVRELGGLHIIGSERHEARRIDNQLRGRAARQGDPGSSRFFLSLEDDLMRMFGGDQVKSVMERFSIDEDYPLQARLVSNMIEQSQTGWRAPILISANTCWNMTMCSMPSASASIPSATGFSRRKTWLKM